MNPQTCKICNRNIEIGDLVHEVPNQHGKQIIMCDACYKTQFEA